MAQLIPFTSESVTEGHPDKVCDLISDTILDAMLAQDADSRVAVETVAGIGLIHVTGEVTTESYVEIPQLVRETICNIGYTSSQIGFDGASCGVTTALTQQSPDIAQGVVTSMEARLAGTSPLDPYDVQGAGDQGFVFGYATNETPTLMPTPIYLAHRLAQKLASVRKTGAVKGLRPDGKTQVTIGYEGNKPKTLNTVVVSTQHDHDVSMDWLEAQMREHVVLSVLEDEKLDLDYSGVDLLVNPTGRFEIGGPMGDVGLTGRKIIVDTYGGMARHGGGAFSGKDPSKVDRSAAYAARWIAKNVVAAELADRCEVQVAYAIGRAHPVSMRLETFGTEHRDASAIEAAVRRTFDMRPAAIIDALDLKRPIYALTSNYGHFGRELDEFTWEKTNRVEDLLKAF